MMPPKIEFNLYLITNRKLCKNENLIIALNEALIGGVKCVQLREKDLSTKDLIDLALKVRELTRKFGAKLLINGRIDICMAIDADGVHLPENGMPVEIARTILGGDKIIGASVHSLEGVRRKSEAGVDFLTLSPVFETSSKPRGTKTLGIEAIRKAKKISKVPIFALGGINAANTREVIRAGADGVAVISAILAAENVRSAASVVLTQLQN